jgi:hypothetical protein
MLKTHKWTQWNENRATSAEFPIPFPKIQAKTELSCRMKDKTLKDIDFLHKLHLLKLSKAKTCLTLTIRKMWKINQSKNLKVKSSLYQWLSQKQCWLHQSIRSLEHLFRNRRTWEETFNTHLSNSTNLVQCNSKTLHKIMNMILQMPNHKKPKLKRLFYSFKKPQPWPTPQNRFKKTWSTSKETEFKCRCN